MSRGAMEVVSEIIDWFASPDGTFLRVFDGQNSSHILARYATDNLSMQKVSYYLSTGLSAALHRRKKAPWLTLPMQIGLYEIKNPKVVDTEGKAIKKFAFGIRDSNPHDYRGIFKDDCARIHCQSISGEFH